MSQGKLTGAAVAEHNSKDSCWVIVHGKAYDVTEFLPGMRCPVVSIQTMPSSHLTISSYL